MRRHLETLKRKPEHVRHMYALGASVAVTGLVAIVWLVGNAATGTFALSTSDSGEQSSTTSLTSTNDSFSKLLGAVGATQGSSSQPQLTVVDGGTTSTLAPAPAASQNQTSATAIPF